MELSPTFIYICVGGRGIWRSKCFNCAVFFSKILIIGFFLIGPSVLLQGTSNHLVMLRYHDPNPSDRHTNTGWRDWRRLKRLMLSVSPKSIYFSYISGQGGPQHGIFHRWDILFFPLTRLVHEYTGCEKVTFIACHVPQQQKMWQYSISYIRQ